MFGLNPILYDKFYTGYNSGVTIDQTRVITSIGGRSYMSLPNVRNYVESYFGCTDGETGGMLEDDGGAGSQASHWERKVYYDELMTASIWPSGNRVSGLSLALYADTGYYLSTDLGAGENFQFGRGKGCSFARGAV